MANTKKFTVTIASAQVPSDQTNVPAYLDLSVLGAGHGFWSAVRSDGGDIRVYNAGGTQLAREIVSVDTVGETGEVHFLADSLLSASNNVFTIEYGDGALTDYLPTDTFGRNAVWADYLAIHHLNNTTSVIDSSGNTSDGTITGSISSVTSPMGDGISIGTGSNEVLLSPMFPSIMPSEFTLQVWWQKKNTNGVLRNLGNTAFDSDKFTSGHNFSDYRTYADGAGSGNVVSFTNDAVSNDVWYLVHDRFDNNDPTSDVRLFRNGSEDTDGTTTAFPSGDNSSEPLVLSPIDNTFWGQMGAWFREHRVADKPINDDQIAIEYANQNDPATFYTLSAEESVGGGSVIDAESGSYTLVGKESDLLFSKSLGVEKGDYSIGGKTADLILSRVLLSEKGDYSLQGKQVEFLRDYLASLEKGDYSITGKQADLLKQITLSVEKGLYTIDGKPADLIYTTVGQFILSAEKGLYSLQGKQVDLLKESVLGVEKGAYLIDGKPADLIFTEVGQFLLSAEKGVYSLGGKQVDLLYTGLTHFLLSADGGSYSIDGKQINLIKDFILSLEPASYTLDGKDSQLLKGFNVSAEKGEYQLTGKQVGFLRDYIASLEKGAYTIDGKDIDLSIFSIGFADSVTLSASAIYTATLSASAIYTVSLTANSVYIISTSENPIIKQNGNIQ